jgi:hypothetical protein
MMEQETRPPDPPEDLAQLAERLNEILREGGAGNAEYAFGLGCSIGLIPFLLVLVVLFFFKVINLILAFILLVMGSLALVGISMLAAQRARASGIRRAYSTSVESEIVQYLAVNELTRAQFDRAVSRLLPHDAPLQPFLTQKEQV